MTSVHSIGAVAKLVILKAFNENKAISNDELANIVVKIFKDKGVEVKTGAASIAWYKNDMRKRGQLPKGAMSGGSKKIAFDINDISFDEKPPSNAVRNEEEEDAEHTIE